MKKDNQKEAKGASNDIQGKSGAIPQTENAKTYREILEEAGEANPAVREASFGKRAVKS